MRLFVALACAPLLFGCVGIQAFFHYPSVTAEYTRAGFTVRDDLRSFRFDASKNVSVLEILEETVLEDEESDDRVDRVIVGPSRYSRGEEGTGALFEKYDRVWRDTTRYLSVPHFRKKWLRMQPPDIAKRWEETRHDP